MDMLGERGGRYTRINKNVQMTTSQTGLRTKELVGGWKGPGPDRGNGRSCDLVAL